MNIAVQMPSPMVTESLVTVWKIEPATDCCDLGNEERTYIWGVMNQRRRRNELERPCTHIGNVELKLGSDNNDGQGI